TSVAAPASVAARSRERRERTVILACRDSGAGPGVRLLAGGHRQVEAVLRRRQRAGGEVGERAGRIVGAVEVERDPALGVRRGGVEVAPRAVAVMAAGAVGEDDEEAAVLALQRLQPVAAAVQGELQGTRVRHRIGSADDAGYLECAAGLTQSA